jgi:hypothetical protein
VEILSFVWFAVTALLVVIMVQLAVKDVKDFSRGQLGSNLAINVAGP